MLVKIKPIIRKEETESLVKAEMIDNELCVTVLKSFLSFKEAKANEFVPTEFVASEDVEVDPRSEAEKQGFFERETTITKEEALNFIADAEEEAARSADESAKRKALSFLKDTDYVVIKIAEGIADKKDYADVLIKRKEARELINS
jgi:hypothetical protein